MFFFFFSSRRRHTRCSRDWSSDVCSSDLIGTKYRSGHTDPPTNPEILLRWNAASGLSVFLGDRKSTRLNSSHGYISYAVFCLKKKNKKNVYVSLINKKESK